MNCSYVSSRNGFLEECLIWKIAILSFRPLKAVCERISANALDNFSGDVSVGKVSIAFGVESRRLFARASRFSGFRARRATARLP